MPETKSRKRKKRDVCEENISKLNLDEEMSDHEVEFNIHYFSETSEKIAMVPTGRRSNMKN